MCVWQGAAGAGGRARSRNRADFRAVVNGMDAEPTPNRPFVFINATELRDHLSEVISRAVFGDQLVVITRRSNRVAAIVSYKDLLFLETMKRRRAEVMSAAPALSGDPSQWNRIMAERARLEDLFT